MNQYVELQNVWQSIINDQFNSENDIYTLNNGGNWLGGISNLLFRQCYTEYVNTIVDENGIKFLMIKGNPGTGCSAAIVNFILIYIVRKFRLSFIEMPDIVYTTMCEAKPVRFVLTFSGEVHMSPKTIKNVVYYEISCSVDIFRPIATHCSVLVSSGGRKSEYRFEDKIVRPNIIRKKGVVCHLSLFSLEECRLISTLPSELLSFRFAVFGGNAKFVLKNVPAQNNAYSKEWISVVSDAMADFFTSNDEMQVSFDEWVAVAKFLSAMVEQNMTLFRNFREYDPLGLFMHDDCQGNALETKWASPFMQVLGEKVLSIVRSGEKAV